VSIRLMTEVRQLKLEPAVKLIVLLLADNANDDGTHCFPRFAGWPMKQAIRKEQCAD